MSEPNLSLEPCGGKLVQRDGCTYERYHSITHLAEARNIPKKILLAANKEAPPGIGHNNSIQWEKFQPWLVQNLDRLHREVSADGEIDENTDIQLSRQKKREEIRKLQHENGRRETEIKNVFLNAAADVRIKWGTILRQKLEYEYPAKCRNMSEIELRDVGRKLCDELLRILSTPISKWEASNDA